MSEEKGIVRMDVGAAVPHRGNIITRGMAKIALLLFGWRVEGVVPNTNKFIVIGAPHTSNWDWFLVITTAYAMGIRISWMMKHTTFKGPVGTLLRWLGGVAIDRRAPRGVVEQNVDAFDQKENLILCITPEGTRSKVREWKKGFYYIAQGANVPIVPAIFDYGRKRVRFAPAFSPTGNFDEDLAFLKSYYSDATPKNPQLY